MNKLIINADDFGVDQDATEAILQLLLNRKIQSTTVIANMAKSDQLKKLAAIENISTGIHINLIEGKPLSEKASHGGLTNKDGDFIGSLKLWLKFLSFRVKRSAIKAEIEAQIKALENTGIKISHADSHQHIHQFPFLSSLILKTLKKNGIATIRNAKPMDAIVNRMRILKLFCRFTNRNLKHFSTTKGLISYFSMHEEFSLEGFETALKNAFRSNETLECMTHPGLSDREQSYLKRKKEFEFWMQQDWQAVLKKLNIKATNFNIF